MTKRLTITLVALAIFVLLAILPVSAATANATNISQGATVFVGESGLNIDAALSINNPAVGEAPMIAWFPSTAQLTATTPEKTITMTGGNNRSFYVNPADFATRTGNWYCWTNSPGLQVGTAGLAFTVADPQMDIKVWDLDQDKDVTGKSVPAGQKLTFRIETNTYSIASRWRLLTPVWNTNVDNNTYYGCLLYTSPSPRDGLLSRMPSSA